MFSIIAAVGKNLEIGKKNDLIFHIPEDMRYFRKATRGKAVIMGSKTFESLHGALKGRRNIILSHSSGDFPPEVEVFHNLDDILAEFAETDEEVFVIGGGTIYRLFLPYAKKLYLTEVNATCDKAEVFFPEFDKKDYKREVVGSGKEGDLTYDFVVYTKKEEL